MKPGDICILIDVEVMGTIIRQTKHPYLDYMKAYDVLDVNGKLKNVSETFVRPAIAPWSSPHTRG